MKYIHSVTFTKENTKSEERFIEEIKNLLDSGSIFVMVDGKIWGIDPNNILPNDSSVSENPEPRQIDTK